MKLYTIVCISSFFIVLCSRYIKGLMSNFVASTIAFYQTKIVLLVDSRQKKQVLYPFFFQF